jgi:hypothetical protein
MDVAELAQLYRTKTDEEILRLAMQSGQLTPEACSLLAGEVTKRGLRFDEAISAVPRPSEPYPEDLGRSGIPSLISRQPTGEFIAEVLRMYRGHFWLFFKIIVPAVVIGTAAVIAGRDEGREIARQMPRGYELLPFRAVYFEILAVHASSWLISWLAFCVSYGAICSAVRQLGRGMIASVGQSFATVRERLGSFLRLSLLLLFLFIVAEVVVLFVQQGVFWVLERTHAPHGSITVWLVILACLGLAYLVLSRFALAVPALVLDNYPVGTAMFRSDELTERKWSILAVLLFKALLGGYVAGMMPFWLAGLIPASVPLPSYFSWLLTCVSVIGVAAVEPVMFVGFALLYLKTSVAATSGQNQTVPA